MLKKKLRTWRYPQDRVAFRNVNRDLSPSKGLTSGNILVMMTG